ncbi:MAG: ATP-binding protein [Kiritimatiellae bacterium]|nr:ATP-binding protein [Kiritimatiellia bacterium]
MKNYPRIYQTMIESHLKNYRQMVFVSGPRQVGKTTMCEAVASTYLSWDDEDVRRAIQSGQRAVADKYALNVAAESEKVLVYDEIHKYSKWKQFLKGFYDLYGRNLRIVATGSAKMDVYKKGGDSMMGRYFPYRMHPLSVAELLDVSIPDERIVRSPKRLSDDEWTALVRFGGFPDPFVNRDVRFSRRWNSLRFEQLLKTDMRDLTRISELDQLSALAEILSNRSGEQLVYKSIGRDLGVDEKTAKKWIKTLKYLYFGFEVRPWFRNIENSIRKMPKWYLRDWANIQDEGKRAETFIACHLLKAVEGWTDLGYGEFSLGYLRDKSRREVDFVVTRDGIPWFLVEVKKSDTSLSEALAFFQKRTGAAHAFQVVMDAAYGEYDCFAIHSPKVVSAKTFLSQLF